MKFVSNFTLEILQLALGSDWTIKTVQAVKSSWARVTVMSELEIQIKAVICLTKLMF